MLTAFERVLMLRSFEFGVRKGQESPAADSVVWRYEEMWETAVSAYEEWIRAEAAAKAARQ